MKRMFLLIPLIVGASIALSQCGREAVSNNSMEKIYEDEGVPVRVETLEPGLFETKLSYHAVLSGIEESSVHAMVSDEVDMIYVQVGDYVEEDQVLISFPPDTPSAKYQQAKVGYENAKLTYERIEQLFQTGGISEQDRDNAKAAYDVAAADWDTYVMVHVYNDESILRSIEAGVISIEHAQLMTEVSAKAIKEADVWVVPFFSLLGLNEEVVRKALGPLSAPKFLEVQKGARKQASQQPNL